MEWLKKITISILTGIILVFAMPIVIPDFFGAYTVEAATIKINKTKYTMIKGQSYTLKITGTNKKVTWSTSNKKIATVTSKGKVTAVKKGTATITAKVGSKKYTCKITVETPSISKSKYTMIKGESYTLKLNGNSQKVTWSTSNKKIATVNSKGKVTAVKKGTATITAKVGNKKYTCKITVNAKKEKINSGTPPVDSFYFDKYGNIYYILGKNQVRYFSASYVNPNMKKKSIGKYKNGTEINEYYVFDDKDKKSVFNFSIYMYEIRDDGWLIITDDTYDSLSDKQKYISINCWQPLDKKLEINENNVTWKISNPDVVKIKYSSDEDFRIIPLQTGKSEITLSCYDLTYTFTITVNNPKVQSNYEYKITDVSENDTWYAGYGGRVIYIETDNPDIDSFQLVGKGISCSLAKGVLKDVIFEDRHFSNWSTNSFTDKKNYFKAKDKKGYYTKIKTSEVGKLNLYIKEGNNTLEDTKLTLTSKGGGKEKYQEWLKYVENQSITSSMTTYEKVKAISNWLYENCYYPTDVYKSGEVCCIEYPESPIWEKPVFDCLAAVNILNEIIKDYDGVEDVHWDGYLFGSGGSHTAKVTIDGKQYTFNACPYRQLKEDIYID